MPAKKKALCSINLEFGKQGDINNEFIEIPISVEKRKEISSRKKKLS